MNGGERDRASGDISFDGFFSRVEPRLRAAFTALYGPDLGRDAAAEALAWAFEHWNRVGRMDHPVGYLYRVGQSRTRSLRRARPFGFVPETTGRLPDLDPRLPAALASLPVRQRVAVVLVHGYDWSPADVADVLHVSVSTVSTHVARGLARLRAVLEVDSHDRS